MKPRLALLQDSRLPLPRAEITDIGHPSHRTPLFIISSRANALQREGKPISPFCGKEGLVCEPRIWRELLGTSPRSSLTISGRAWNSK